MASNFPRWLGPHSSFAPTIVSALALTLALAFTGTAFAEDVNEDAITAKTQADCDKAGGMWDAEANLCSSKSESE